MCLCREYRPSKRGLPVRCLYWTPFQCDPRFLGAKHLRHKVCNGEEEFEPVITPCSNRRRRSGTVEPAETDSTKLSDSRELSWDLQQGLHSVDKHSHSTKPYVISTVAEGRRVGFFREKIEWILLTRWRRCFIPFSDKSLHSKAVY